MINVQDIIIENDFLVDQNANYRSYTQDLADFILPRKAWITSIRTRGERVKFNFLYDSTAIRALRNAASGFYSNLTSPATRWFALETLDKDLMKDLAIRTWFSMAEDSIYAILSKSNFYNIILEFFMDYVGFGTSTYLMLEDPIDRIRFTSIPVEQTNRVEDGNGRLSAMYRNFRLTARQANQMWGGRAGENVAKSLEKKPFEMFDFIHYVAERHVREAGKADSVNMPFASAWIARKDKHLILESGFREMPYMSDVFYRDSNDTNGFSPAMDVFPDIKLANAMKKTLIRSDMKKADPPLVAPSRGFILPLNFNPAAMNYRDAKTPQDALAALPVGQGNLGMSVEFLKSIQDDIKDGMFVPLFRALNDVTKQMTIPEIQHRTADNMALLGPVVGRVIHGILDPTIIRLFNMLLRNNELPEPPERLQDQEYAPVYLSRLAKAQKQTEIGEIQSYLTDVQAIASIIPSAMDNIDEDKTVNALARIRGITPDIMRDEEAIQRMRKHREEQEQLISSLQTGQAVAGMAKDGAAAQQASGGG